MIRDTRFRYLNEALTDESYNTTEEYMADQYGLVDLYLELYRIWLEKQQDTNHDEIYAEIQYELALATDYIQTRTDETFMKAYFPLEQIKKIFQFTEFEVFCFLLSSATSRGGKYRTWYTTFNKGNDLTLGLAKELYQFTHENKMSFYQEFHNLKQHWNLIYGEEFQREASVVDKKLIMRPEILSYLYEDISLCKELEFCATLQNRSNLNTINVGEGYLFLEEQQQKMITMFREAKENKFLFYLQGRSGSGKKYLISKVASTLCQSVVYVDSNALRYKNESEQLNILNGIFLTAILQKAWVCFELKMEAEEWIANAQEYGLSCVVLLRDDLPITNKLHQLDYTYFRVEIPLLTSEQRIATWEYFINKRWYADKIDCTNLGNKYVLSAGEITSILDTVDLEYSSGCGQEVDNHTMIKAVQMHNRNVLDEYAKLVKCSFEWEDLIVEAEVEDQLRKVCNRVLYRNIIGEQWGFYEKTSYGRGICTVFAGPPGTGKTMAAQVIAKELGYELYRIDLSKMVSKYIGETQKNISQLFEKAKMMNVILFFDEADAFFSKRSDVSDSNDRHSNSEVAHLLQEIEDYEGICILATNLKGNMDDAFKRRIKYVIDFRLPNADTRLLLWKSMIPEKTPISEEVDIEYFAKEFDLSGSEIKEIIMSAAFIAAADGEMIENIHIVEAIKISYSKYGKVLRTEDFHCLI